MATRERSVLLVFEPPEGGVSEHVLQLGLGLSAYGWRPEIAGPETSPFLDSAKNAGIRTHPMSFSRKSPGGIFRSIRALRTLGSNRFDVIHAHSSVAGVATRSAFRSGPPVVYTPHCFGFLSNLSSASRWSSRFVERALAPRTAMGIAASRWELDAASEKLPALRSKLVYYGVPACEIGRLRGREDPVRVTFMSRLEAQKDPLCFVRALSSIPSDIWARMQVRMVGNGSLGEAVRSELEMSGLSERVEVIPFSPPAQEYLKATDVYVLPSLWESLPISVLEAMRCGVAVVATDVSGTPEAIRDQHSGLLVSPRDPEGLAAAIADLVSDHEKRIALAARAREEASQRFSVERMVSDTAGVYDSVV